MEPYEGRSRIGRPVQPELTTELWPVIEEERSYWVLTCTQAVLLTQRWYRRRFESHLGLGTFSNVNLYLFYPFFLHSLFLLNLYLILIHTGVTSRQRRVSSFNRTSMVYFTLGSSFLQCPNFIWLLLLQFRFTPMGVEPGIAGSPGPGFYHWATATVEDLTKLRNFI